MSAMTWLLPLNAIAQASAAQIVDCLVEGTLIATLAGLMLSVSRRQHSGTRFAVWFSALMAMAALPLLRGMKLSSAGGYTFGHATVTLPGSWAMYLFGAWAAIAAVQLAGVVRGLAHLRALRASCETVDPSALDGRLQATLARAASREVELCVSDRVQVPTAIGLVRPAVLLPRWILQELSAEELNQILVHELAHLRRWDDWTNLAQKIVKAVLFFHPAVWWVEKRISLEREMACDEAVLAETASPRAYAECLTNLAEKTLVQRSIALAQAALGRIHQTSLRVAQILDVNRPVGSGRARKSAVATAMVVAVVCVAGLSRAPRLVAFSDAQGTHAASPAVPFEAVTDHSAPSMPMIPASAKMVTQRAPRLTRAKLAAHRKPVVPQRTATVQPPTPEQVAESMFHLTSVEADAFAVTETVFVVVQGEANGAPDAPQVQIQMWRVVVLHPAVNPESNRIPAKQT